MRNLVDTELASVSTRLSPTEKSFGKISRQIRRINPPISCYSCQILGPIVSYFYNFFGGVPRSTCKSDRRPEAAEQHHIKKANINTPIKTPRVMTIKPEEAACVCVCAAAAAAAAGERGGRRGAAAKWEEGRRRKERSSVYARPLAITIFLLIIKSRMRVGRRGRGGGKAGGGGCHTRAGEKHRRNFRASGRISSAGDTSAKEGGFKFWVIKDRAIFWCALSGPLSAANAEPMPFKYEIGLPRSSKDNREIKLRCGGEKSNKNYAISEKTSRYQRQVAAC